MASMTIDTPKSLSTEDHHQSLLSRATAVFVFLFEKVMPDPYVFAVLLTFLGVVLARLFAPNATFPSIASAWYGGIFAIFAFAFQMVIMLVAGYALAMAPPVHRLLASIAGRSPRPSGQSRSPSSSASSPPGSIGDWGS